MSLLNTSINNNQFFFLQVVIYKKLLCCVIGADALLIDVSASAGYQL